MSSLFVSFHICKSTRRSSHSPVRSFSLQSAKIGSHQILQVSSTLFQVCKSIEIHQTSHCRSFVSSQEKSKISVMSFIMFSSTSLAEYPFEQYWTGHVCNRREWGKEYWNTGTWTGGNYKTGKRVCVTQFIASISQPTPSLLQPTSRHPLQKISKSLTRPSNKTSTATPYESKVPRPASVLSMPKAKS